MRCSKVHYNLINFVRFENAESCLAVEIGDQGLYVGVKPFYDIGFFIFSDIYDSVCHCRFSFLLLIT